MRQERLPLYKSQEGRPPSPAQSRWPRSPADHPHPPQQLPLQLLLHQNPTFLQLTPTDPRTRREPLHKRLNGVRASEPSDLGFVLPTSVKPGPSLVEDKGRTPTSCWIHIRQIFFNNLVFISIVTGKKGAGKNLLFFKYQVQNTTISYVKAFPTPSWIPTWMNFLQNTIYRFLDFCHSPILIKSLFLSTRICLSNARAVNFSSMFPSTYCNSRWITWASKLFVKWIE